MNVLRIAAGLISEHGENFEYDRAIAEMSCELLGVNTESKAEMLTLLRSVEL